MRPAAALAYLTTSVPSIPAIRCPGTEQKNLYVPGLRFSDSVFEPPLNVGVAPSFWPEEDSIVTLCSSGDMFVKSIDTLPELAVSDFVLYASWPSLFASRLRREEPAPALDAAPVEVLAVEDVLELVLGVVALVLEEPLELELLPHPASASSAASSASGASA